MPQRGTTNRNNVRVGDFTGIAATNTIGAVTLAQRYAVASVPLSGTRAFTLPSSAEIVEFTVYNSQGSGEHTVRFGAVGAGGSNFYGQISISAAGVYKLTNPSTAGSVWAIGGSSQPIGISVVSASGDIASVAGGLIVNVVYFRKYNTGDT